MQKRETKVEKKYKISYVRRKQKIEENTRIERTYKGNQEIKNTTEINWGDCSLDILNVLKSH